MAKTIQNVVSATKQDVSIRPENVQRIYTFFDEGKFIVNRKYQRKLVWNVEEKQKFIDSISKTYPVPLFLLATINLDDTEKYEIIDGMQRLNAINSFIEQEFGIILADGQEYYFDLTTMPDTNIKKDSGSLLQKEPKLDRVICARIANYPLPLSVYTINSPGEIDEIFRRINSGGKQLSHQEVRQSSSLGDFANSVRKIASKIRGDDSSSDILLLNDMSKISISNRIKLNHYGINVDEIFWVKQSVLSRERVRQSNDEEIIADILGGMILPNEYTSNKEILDNLYGIYSGDSYAKKERHDTLENTLSKDQEYWINIFIKIYDEIRKILSDSGENLNDLININARTSKYATKHFLTVFLAIYELIEIDRRIVNDYKSLAAKLKASRTSIHISGGYYSGKYKRTNIDAVKGIINTAFRVRTDEENNPVYDRWFTKLENILMSSYTEQALYEFKQGFHKLDRDGEFNDNLVEKVVKTLTAMANFGRGARGYVIVGIADDEQDSIRIDNYYSKLKHQARVYNNFYIPGINNEVESYYEGNYDKYLIKIQDKVKQSPVDKGFIANNVTVRQINYYDKALIVFEVTAASDPTYYGDSFYVRSGNSCNKVETRELNLLYAKFSSKA